MSVHFSPLSVCASYDHLLATDPWSPSSQKIQHILCKVFNLFLFQGLKLFQVCRRIVSRIVLTHTAPSRLEKSLLLLLLFRSDLKGGYANYSKLNHQLVTKFQKLFFPRKVTLLRNLQFQNCWLKYIYIYIVSISI